MKERADGGSEYWASPSSTPRLDPRACVSVAGCSSRTVVEGSSMQLSSEPGAVVIDLDVRLVHRRAGDIAEVGLPTAALVVALVLPGDGAREVGTDAGGDGARETAADVGGDGKRDAGTDDGCEGTREQVVDAAVECTQETDVEEVKEPQTSIGTENRTQPLPSSTPSRAAPQASL